MRAPTTSWWWKLTAPLANDRVFGLPTSWNSAASRTMSSGRVLHTTAIVCARTSLWVWIGSCSSRIAFSSGRNSSDRRVSTRSHKPALGSSVSSSFDSSSRMRSALTISRRWRSCSIAPTSSGSGASPNCATKRAARSMRSGSSRNDSSGASGVRRRRAARSTAPSKGSTSSGSGRRSAIAFTVKSRRERSVLMSSEKATSGLRLSGR